MLARYCTESPCYMCNKAFMLVYTALFFLPSRPLQARDWGPVAIWILSDALDARLQEVISGPTISLSDSQHGESLIHRE